VTYDHLSYPADTSFTPLAYQETSRDQWSPKAGIVFAPWNRGLLRASYTRSLGGLFFDNSIRLEPTQVGGFNQAFRSLIPESVAGLVPGASFETKEVGFDQSLAAGTFFGAEYGWLTSDGNRPVGVLTNSTFLPIPDSSGSTAQRLDFQEQYVSAYAAQLLGDYCSASARYRWNDAQLTEKFPAIPDSAAGLSQIEQNNTAVLNQVALQLNFNHPSGVFGQWDSSWYQQQNFGYSASLPGADFWQHNVMVGYRFWHRHAEVRAGVLNLFDTDYRLNPLSAYAELPRSRMFVASVRLNF
jgi:outer membrane receptor protein involved in Fe transport